MNSRAELKSKAKLCLGGNIFAENWLLGLVVCLLCGAILSAASYVTFGAASIILSGPLEIGMAWAFMNNAKGAKIDVSDLFYGFKNDFGGAIVVWLLKNIFTFLWSLLFFIPGIVKSYSYSFAYFIKNDNPSLSASECIGRSKELTHGHKWQLFVLDLSFVGWFIVGALCLGIGTLWVAPYYYATKVQMYKEITGQNA